MSVQAKTFTVRFPTSLHRAAREAAAREKQSLNAWLRAIAEARLREEEERELYDSFSRLGEEECDAEFYWHAQREAIEMLDD